MNIRYTVQLSDDERAQLAALVAAPGVGPQKRTRAQLLLACDIGVPDATVAETLRCGTSTIYEEAIR